MSKRREMPKSAKGTSRAAERIRNFAKASGLGVPVLRGLCESAKGTSRAAERIRNFAKSSGLGVPVLRGLCERLEQDLLDHIERETQDNIERGMPAEEARYAALRKFGNRQLIKENTRAVWIPAAAEQIWQDAKFSLRILSRERTFAAIAILTLAIGIAVNTAVFSVVNTVVLRSLPYPDAARLVAFADGTSASKGSHFKPGIAAADFAEWLTRAKSFECLAGYSYADQTISMADSADRIRVVTVAGDFWQIVGANPVIGHLFNPARTRNEVVLSYAVFAGQFKGDPKTIGRTVRLDGKPLTVAGVLPRSFGFYFPQDWWNGLAPAEAGAFVASAPLVRSPPSRLFVVGRLKPNVPASAALLELQTLETAILNSFPDIWFPGIAQMQLVPLQTQLLGTNRQGLFILQIAGVLVLLIACMNIANLLLARGASRLHEIAIRTAIGAGAVRILRQFLAEGAVLALLGGAAGLLFTKWMLMLFRQFGPQSLPRLSEITVDGTVVAFVLLLCLGSGVFFGFGPAIALWKSDIASALKAGARNSSGSSAGLRIRRILVASEIAFAVVLLTGAGLMVKSFWRMYSSPPGFEPENTLIGRLALSGPAYADKNKQLSFLREVLDRMQSTPGVEAFGLSDAQDYIIQSKDPAKPALVDQFRDCLVSTGYFQAMGMRLKEGRLLSAADAADATVINETMAHRVFGQRDPLGQKIEVLGRDVRVIGVVGNLKYAKLDADPVPEIFRNYETNLGGGNVNMTLVIRMTGYPLGMASTLTRSLGTIDPTQPVYKLETLQTALAESISVRRFELFLLVIFAAAALVMAIIGIYGVIAYSVTQRTKEIGIRMAMGAQRTQVVAAILKQGLSIGLCGIAAGIVVAFGFTRWMAAVLYGVQPRDPDVIFGVACIVFFVLALATSGPARNAALIDPLIALRHE
jgi:putative ABC transport system permease protein